MLAVLNSSTFAEHLGSNFRLTNGEEESVDLELIEVECHRPVLSGLTVEREPFSLIFRGPQRPSFPQQIFRLTHEILPELNLFLVPIGPDDHGMLYQAIFS